MDTLKMSDDMKTDVNMGRRNVAVITREESPARSEMSGLRWM